MWAVPACMSASCCLLVQLTYLSQLVVLRSTVYPGVTALVEKRLAQLGVQVDVAFCPERILEGHAMTELYSLPQIIGTRNEQARSRAAALFGKLTDKLVFVDPEEAELAKLFTNVWRYIKFAAVNQFYMIANNQGLDFEHIRKAIAQDYDRAADMPRAGFAAGPCLFKDTMQLGAFNDNNFALGHAAMLVNEGLPLYVVSRLEEHYDLSQMTVGILGMSFKGGSDDIRSSLSYKIKRILTFKAKQVLTTDPYVKADPDLLPLAEVVQKADLFIVATPHREYQELESHQAGRGRLGSLRQRRPNLTTRLASQEGREKHAEGLGDRFGRLYRRLPRRRAAGPGLVGCGPRQLLEVRPATAVL